MAWKNRAHFRDILQELQQNGDTEEEYGDLVTLN